MRKLKLDDLTVESFDIDDADGGARGTVRGLESEVATCVTCLGLLCYGSKRQTGCCTQDPFEGCTDGFNC